MVKVDKEYVFDAENGSKTSLLDLFDGKTQLIVYHFMYSPSDDTGCYGCSHVADALPDVRHLRYKDTNLVCISRAPVDKLHAFKKDNDWSWPWYSSEGSDFNYDFYATIDPSVSPAPLVNYRNEEELSALGLSLYVGENHGLSVFYRKNDDIYHSYSTFDRGVDNVMPTFALLDLTPKGRQVGSGGPGEFKLKYEYDDMV